jgi:hypothetical protein
VRQWRVVSGEWRVASVKRGLASEAQRARRVLVGAPTELVCSIGFSLCGAWRDLVVIPRAVFARGICFWV